MTLTVEQILEETRSWPHEKISELLIRLSEDLHTADPQSELAWKEESRRRLEEIEKGVAELVDGEEVSARIRRIVGR